MRQSLFASLRARSRTSSMMEAIGTGHTGIQIPNSTASSLCSGNLFNRVSTVPTRFVPNKHYPLNCLGQLRGVYRKYETSKIHSRVRDKTQHHRPDMVEETVCFMDTASQSTNGWVRCNYSDRAQSKTRERNNTNFGTETHYSTGLGRESVS